jgi:hypothetical protein
MGSFEPPSAEARSQIPFMQTHWKNNVLTTAPDAFQKAKNYLENL